MRCFKPLLYCVVCAEISMPVCCRQFRLPTTFELFQAHPTSSFIDWVTQLENDTFVVPVALLDGEQHRLLLDFTRTWAFLRCHEYLKAIWEEFLELQLSLAYSGLPGGAPAPSSNAQLVAISQWARQGFPVCSFPLLKCRELKYNLCHVLGVV